MDNTDPARDADEFGSVSGPRDERARVARRVLEPQFEFPMLPHAGAVEDVERRTAGHTDSDAERVAHAGVRERVQEYFETVGGYQSVWELADL